ncbi:MAG: glycosyl transferase [Bacteroidetes bacterium]|nr:glycosyl transferase [Bacteroidota bacterium]
MGHTTRTVPVIRYLRDSGHEVIFAGNDRQHQYISKTFLNIQTIHLDGYNVWYSKNAIGFLPALFIQLPRLLKTISKEKKWLKRIVKEYKIDGVITDNRYGLHLNDIPNVIMTHQVAPQTGWGWLPDKTLRYLHDKSLLRFKECWIVDVADEPNLSGSLSHPKKQLSNAKYIGLLSQIGNQPTSEKHLLVLLSGPEPQRTILSDMLWEQLKNHEQKIVFVEGSDRVTRQSLPSHIEYHQRLTANELTPLIASASVVICRSGYSTLMDLVKLNKKAIVIPTPGQAEQEYLGEYLHKQGVFYCASQKSLDIIQALQRSKGFPFSKLNLSSEFEQHQTAIDDWLQKL